MADCPLTHCRGVIPLARILLATVVENRMGLVTTLACGCYYTYVDGSWFESAQTQTAKGKPLPVRAFFTNLPTLDIDQYVG